MRYSFILLVFSVFITCKSQDTIASQIAPKTEVRSIRAADNPKNIIFLIGDGMGLSQITLGMLANGNKTALEAYPVVGLHKCPSSDKLITDSAAAATAFACGVRTYNGAIGVDADTMPLTTILEMAEAQGLATGLVATSTIVHATPASYIAHDKYRKNYEAIAKDFMDVEVDLIIGGGKKYFERRVDDNDNLLDTLRSRGYLVRDFLTEISDLPIKTTDNIAYFTADTDPLPVSQGRDYLVEASKYTLDYLKQKNENGFFAMIEGSQIDWGGHANLQEYVISEYLEYDQVIQYAREWAELDGETLVVVTADHETGGLAIQPESTPDSLVTAFTSTYHTGVMIPVFAFGPGSEKFAGIYDNTEIFFKMVEALGLE